LRRSHISPATPLFISCFYSSRAHRDLHSFPTRRSSDLRPAMTITRPCPTKPLDRRHGRPWPRARAPGPPWIADCGSAAIHGGPRSEEHTSELQSLNNLVFRLLLEKKQNT